MGRLDKISNALDGIKESNRREQLIAEFGLDPSVFDEPPEITDSDIQGGHLKCISESIEAMGESLKDTSTEQLTKIDESTTAQVIEIQVGLRKLVKAIGDASKGQDKRLESSIKSQGEALQASIGTLVEAVSSIEHTIVVEPPVIPAPVAIQFDIERNNQGYIASVIARPADSIEKPVKITEVEYD
jgi:hypothetical protein